MTVVFAAALLAIAAFAYILLVRPQDIPAPVPVSPVQHLEDRKQAIYENLRDLQFEYRLGKLSDQDYSATKLALQRELATVLAEREEVLQQHGIRSEGNAKASSPGPSEKGTRCPHCSATFPAPLKFCGECGRAMA